MTLALLLFACHWIEPTTSSESALVGRVLAPGGFPASDLRIDGLEASDFTDDEGHFAVRYKSDSAYVTLQQEATWFRRRYRPADEGKVVDIQLPELEPRRLQCHLPEACRAKLTWDLGDGLFAWVEVPCQEGATVPLPGVPGSTPEVSCTAGAVSVPTRLVEREGALALLPEPAAILVTLEAGPEVPLEACSVVVAGKLAPRGSDDVFVGKGVPGDPVMAQCEGWPAVPLKVPADSRSVQVPWLGEGPTVDIPEAQTLTLVSSDWSLTLRSEDGVFRLPPLTAGNYRVALDAPTALVGASLPEPVSDTLVLRDAVGVLRLTADTPSGALRISR